MNHSLYKNKGYTLIEIMVSLAIFSILAMLTSHVILRASNIEDRLKKNNNDLSKIQFASTLLKKNIREATKRSIYVNDMQYMPGLIGEDNYIEFSRRGVNPNSKLKESSIKRVAFICKNQNLIFRSWPILDTLNYKKYTDLILLTDVKDCKFAYINTKRERLKNWQIAYTEQTKKNEQLPIAVQLNLEIKNLGKMSFLYPIPESLYAAN